MKQPRADKVDMVRSPRRDQRVIGGDHFSQLVGPALNDVCVVARPVANGDNQIVHGARGQIRVDRGLRDDEKVNVAVGRRDPSSEGAEKTGMQRGGDKSSGLQLSGQ